VTDDDLRELLTDALSDVEPAYRLDVIRARTSRPARRRGWYAAGGAILAAAAVVTAVSVVNESPAPRPTDPDIADRTPTTTTPGPQHSLAAYFVGDTPQGPRLYREYFRIANDADDRGAVLVALQSDAEDPDYRSLWPQGTLAEYTSDPEAGIVFVYLTEDLSERPDGMSKDDARLALQQVVYSIQALFQERLDVGFQYLDPQLDESESRMLDRVLGERGPYFNRAPENEVLSLVSISDPTEGLNVEGSFVARGRANSYEANVPWQIRDEADDVVLEGFATAEGAYDRLYPWEAEIDVSELAPGRYTFVVMTDDPSGGEGPGPFTDTRTIIVD
jgi:hypothetical protein